MNTFNININATSGSNKKVHSSSSLYVAAALGLLSSSGVQAETQTSAKIAQQPQLQELSLERRQFSVSSQSIDVHSSSVISSSAKGSEAQEAKLQYGGLAEDLKRLHQGAALNRLWQPAEGSGPIKRQVNSPSNSLGNNDGQYSGAGEVQNTGSKAFVESATLTKGALPEKINADQGLLPMTREQRMAAKTSENASGTAALRSSGGFHRFTIYDAHSHLLEDFDGDNFYSTFSVTFDADVDGIGVNEYANVYAELYVSEEGGPWLHYYSTKVFSIAGSTGYDDYRVLTTLQSGYQTAHYDVLIDLYEVGFSEPVASLSSNDTNALYALPLESRDRDPLYVDTYPETYIEVEAGGALSWWELVVLAGLSLLAIRKRV